MLCSGLPLGASCQILGLMEIYSKGQIHPLLIWGQFLTCKEASTASQGLRSPVFPYDHLLLITSISTLTTSLSFPLKNAKILPRGNIMFLYIPIQLVELERSLRF